MSVLFEFLDRYLLEDELMNSWNKFKNLKKFVRKHCQNIGYYVAEFDLKFGKLNKLNIKLPTEVLAFKLPRNANLSKQERMIVMTGVDFGDLTEEEAEMGQAVSLEAAWKSASSSYR